jgi:hypothetical protein
MMSEVSKGRQLKCYTWSLDKGDAELVERLVQALEETAGMPMYYEIIEIASYGELLHEGPAWGIAFGSIRGINDPDGMVIELPALSCLTSKKENRNWRKGAFESIKMIAKAMNEDPNPEEVGPEDVKTYVKTDEGHTVGKEDTDFIIDEATAEYARKIKDLVGGRAYMEKNGIKVEIK